MRISMRLFTSLFVVTTLSACGGSKPEAEEPKSETAAPSEGSSSRSEAAAPEEKKAPEASSDAKKKEDAPAPEEAKSIRTAKDIVTREGVFFELSFAASDAHQEADKHCSEKAKDDPKKKADCMTKASQQMESDGIAFREAEGKWWWYSIRRQGPKMVPVHKIEIDFADEKDKSVAIVPKGRDQGTKPMGRVPDKVVVDVASDSEISITDPKLGKLVYTAKMGLFGKDERGAP
jgi:hypothetical protein